jgi:hypothetical protein
MAEDRDGRNVFGEALAVCSGYSTIPADISHSQ